MIGLADHAVIFMTSHLLVLIDDHLSVLITSPPCILNWPGVDISGKVCIFIKCWEPFKRPVKWSYILNILKKLS